MYGKSGVPYKTVYGLQEYKTALTASAKNLNLEKYLTSHGSDTRLPDLKLLQHLETYLTAHRLTRFKQVLDQRTKHFTVATEDVYQLHNTSAVMRTCDVFGLQELNIVEEINSKSIDGEIAMGAQKWVDLNRFDTVTDSEAYLGSVAGGSDRYLSEDYFFCQFSRKLGYQIFLCPWMELGHMGSYVFSGSMASLANLEFASHGSDNQKVSNHAKRRKNNKKKKRK